VEKGGGIVEVDVARQKVVRRFRTGGGPHNLTVGPDGTVAATLYGSDAIVLVRQGRLTRVTLGGRPHDVKIARKKVVVANEGAARLDLVSVGGERLGKIPLRANPHDIAVQPGTDRVWASLDGNDRLAVADLSTGRVRYIPTGDRPHDLLFAPDGRLFVTDWSGALHVFSKTGKALGTVALGRQSHHLAFTPNGRQVWVTDNALHRIFVVATAGLRILARIRFPGAPHHVAITPDGRVAVVADNTRGSLVIYRVATRRRIGSVAVGQGPHGIWAVPVSAG
jgi:DNA-binding beta-propeller fold protein YncE